MYVYLLIAVAAIALDSRKHLNFFPVVSLTTSLEI